MERHAYLIITHNNFYILEKIIKLVDDIRNDIYIHIDKKVRKFDFNYYKSIVKYSNITFVERINIGWAAFSMIRAELNLFKAAYNKYEYYHLISGVDLPIKNQDYIHNFFKENKEKEFLTYLNPEFTQKKNIEARVDKYYFFQELGRINKVIKILNRISIKIQNILHVNRYDNRFKICYGSQWCSLTNYAVGIILKEENWIYKTFKYTQCCDEVYKQTILVNNNVVKKNLYIYKYNNNHISYNMRHIDWNRGAPYIFKMKDYKELQDIPSLFARKFDQEIDKNIVDKIYEMVK